MSRFSRLCRPCAVMMGGEREGLGQTKRERATAMGQGEGMKAMGQGEGGGET